MRKCGGEQLLKKNNIPVNVRLVGQEFVQRLEGFNLGEIGEGHCGEGAVMGVEVFMENFSGSRSVHHHLLPARLFAIRASTGAARRYIISISNITQSAVCWSSPWKEFISVFAWYRNELKSDFKIVFLT